MRLQMDIGKKVVSVWIVNEATSTCAGHIVVNGVPGKVVWGRREGLWEHVSFSPFDETYIPSWEDMCEVKRIFWKDDEPVIQFFPADTEKVNLVPNCMHLWAPRDPETRRRLEMPIRSENGTGREHLCGQPGGEMAWPSGQNED